MSLLTWLKAEVVKLESNNTVTALQADVEAIGDSAFNYIKANALGDLYKIATAALLGVATGTPWATITATVVTQGEAAGITIAKGAESIVLAQAQADLIAAGSLVAPSTGAVVAPVAPAAA
jgi:hypothetical protein